MFGWITGLGKVLGIVDSSDTASKLAGDLSSGVDMMFHTDEEKAIEAAQAFQAWLRMVETMKGSEQYRSVTRRLLAVFIVFNLICMIWLCIFAELSSSMGWLEIATATADNLTFTTVTWSILKIATIFQLGWVFCTIIVFYFGPHLIQFFNKGK